MKSTRKIALVAVAAVAAYAVIRSFGGDSDTSDKGEDPTLLLDRVWVDSQPEKLTDYIQASYFASRQSLGVFQFGKGETVTISVSNKDTDGYVVVDGVQLLRRVK